MSGQLPSVPTGLPGSATAALEQAGGAVSHAAGALLGSAPGGLDVDHLAEVLEQRVLRQIERRGGRYSGMF